ncbi:MAG: DUF1801 domain-containing protein [Planctomycetota bacterium]
MPKNNPQVDDYLEALDPAVRALAGDLRKHIFSSAKKVTEEFKWSRPVYSADQPFCSFQVAKKHISLSFNQGATLEDPDGLLEGPGKAMRHVKLSLEHKKVPRGVIQLLKRAAQG